MIPLNFLISGSWESLKIEANYSDQVSMLSGKYLQNKRYFVKEYLNDGEFGRIHACENTELKTQLAIKQLFVPDREAFLREAKACFFLVHENICSIKDYFEEDGGFYLVMELLQGKDLEKIIAFAKILTTEQTLLVVKKIAEALKHAHSPTSQKPKILHRDIKPANIFITQDGEVKLLDFGIAKCLDEVNPSKTQNGHTPQYSDPDLWKNFQYYSHGYSEKNDFFSLGAVAYEMLFGEKLITFELSSPTPKISENVRENIGKLPSKTQSILKKLLAIEKTKFYSNAEELIADLEAHNVKGEKVLIQIQAMKPTNKTIKRSEPLTHRRDQNKKTKIFTVALLIAASILVAMQKNHEYVPLSSSKSRAISSDTTMSPVKLPKNITRAILIKSAPEITTSTPENITVADIDDLNKIEESTIECANIRQSLIGYYDANNLMDLKKMGSYYSEHLQQAYATSNISKDEFLLSLDQDFKTYQIFKSDIIWESLKVSSTHDGCRINFEQVVTILKTDGVKTIKPVKSIIKVNQDGKIFYFRDWLKK